MKQIFVLVAAISSMVALGSCSEQVMNEEMGEGLPKGESLLRVQTRSETPPQEGKVYVMNSDGDCVRLLTTDEGGQLASTNLVAGTYTLYAVGGEDLSAYTLPDRDHASAESIINLAEGKETNDLFMTSGTVTLTGGNIKDQPLELERQVIQFKQVTIKKVPTDVTQVDVTISELHEGIKLDGTLTEGKTRLAISLTKNSDNTTWTNGDNQPYAFPSNGNPKISVSFTKSSGVNEYTYDADEEFTANRQVVMEGTYSEEQAAVLSGTLTTKAWSAERSMPFEFDEANLVGGDSSENPEELEVPVAGGTYRGYYVVSVNDASKRAVFLSKTQYNGIGNAAAMESKASQIEKPVGEGISCGEWRLPTIEECRVFLEDHNVEGKLYNTYYYCIDGDILKMMSASKSSDVITVKGPLPSNNSSAPYENGTYFRAVIDITY